MEKQTHGDTIGGEPAGLPLESAGAQLRRAREAAGMTVAQVAAATRIPQRHLEVIEAGDYDALPARTYATGFARTYAKAVGLDPQHIVKEVRGELATTQPVRPRVATFEPGDPARVPSRGLALFSALALVLLLAGGAMFYSRFLSPGAGPGSLIDQEQAASRAAAAQAAAAPTVASSAAASAPAGPVVFTALEDGVWVKFYDGSGKQLMQKQMAKGESYTVPADAAAPQVWTGRPDALAITIGGQPVPKLAEREGRIKDVPVSAAALMARANAAGAAPAAATPSPAASAAPAAAVPAG